MILCMFHTRIHTNSHTHNLKQIFRPSEFRVAKFDAKVGSRRTTKIKIWSSVIILVVLILLPYSMYVVLVLILLFLLGREK